MKLLLILRPVPKGLFFQIRDIVNNIPMIRNVNENNSTVVFLESSDMGKKYIVFYDKKEHKAYKLFWKIITDIVSDEYVKYWSKKDLIEIGNYTKEKNNILTIYFEFHNSDYSLLDKQSIYNNLLCQIENAKLSKKDEDILNIPALKKLKKCLKEYNKTISQIDELLQSSCYISITFQMDDFVKNRKSFLQEKSNINKIMSKVNQLEGDPIENNKLLSKLIHLKELIDETSKNLSILEKRMSRLEKSDLSETEKRILSEAGKLETIENGFLEYDDNLIKIVDLDSLDYSDLERILKNVSDSIYDLFYEYETYIIHKNIGWQQLCSEYVYRDFNTISKLDLNGIKFDITGQYEMLKKYLNAADKDTFPLLLFAYMLFAINKSLFNSSEKKFAVNIINPYNIEANETLIEYILRLNMNFTNLGVYLNNNFLRYFNKEFQIPSNFINPLCLKSTRYKLQDFPVFLYKLNPKKETPKLSFASNYKNKKIKIKRVISDSVLQKELKSQISYIFLNIKNEENVFLNINSTVEIEDDILQYNLPESFDETFGFSNLIKDYKAYIADILSNEISQNDKDYKSKILEKINDEFFISNTIGNSIFEFIKELLKSYSRDKFTIEFFLYLKKRIYKFSFSQLEDIGIGFNKCENNDEKLLFVTRFSREYKFFSEYTGVDSKELLLNANDSIEEFKEFIADIAVNRYHELLLNEYIYTKNYKPKFFNNLYSKAEKELKKSLSGKKYDRVQVSRCSFLLAAMISFKDYIDDCLPEAAEDFNQYFQTFNNTILQMCCEIPNKSIDNSTALSEFSAFLKTQIDNNTIIDATSGTDSQIGWIDRKKNKIYLKNTSGNNFYDDFQKYLIKHSERIEISKQAFVRDILEEKGIITARYAGGGKRYDSERKIGEKKYRVLVLGCDLLGIH